MFIVIPGISLNRRSLNRDSTVCTSLSHYCEYRCHTSLNIAVTALSCSCHHYHTSVHSVGTALSLSSLLQRCQFTSLITIVAAIAVTVLFGLLLSQHSYRDHTSDNCHGCDINVDGNAV